MGILVALDGAHHTADLIYEVRTGAGLTQVQLAERLATKQPVISRWESGGEEPRLSTLNRIVQACGHRLVLTVEPDDVDRTQIRELLRLSPRQRLDLLAADSAGLDRLLHLAGR